MTKETYDNLKEKMPKAKDKTVKSVKNFMEKRKDADYYREQELKKLHKKLFNMDPVEDEEEYDKVLKRITELNKMKPSKDEKKGHHIDGRVIVGLATVAASVFQTLVICEFEDRGGCLYSKSWQFMQKFKTDT